MNITENYALHETISIGPYNLQHPAHTFLLRVKDNSMTSEGILNGDIVFLDTFIVPSVGDIIAAKINESWTLTYFQQEYSTLNAAMEIGGVVIKVIREYN